MRQRQPKHSRYQGRLFAPPLDAMVRPDHPVRDLWRILQGHDWGPWHARYRAQEGRPGRPAIGPMRLAAVIILGWLYGVFSSRKLEEAVEDWLPMRWIMEEMTVDHSTICRFRLMFREELLDLLRYVIRKAVEEGFANLSVVVLDGTRIRANSSRRRTLTREQVERELEEVARVIEEKSREAEEAEERELLERELEEQRARLAALQRQKEELEKVEEARRQNGTGNAERACVPAADPESRLLPNKEGGYAPNYTAMVVVEARGGYVVAGTVVSGSDEASELPGLIERVEEDHGVKVECVVGDTSYSTGENLAYAEERGLELVSPLPDRAVVDEELVEREDLSEPVPEERLEKLPVDPTTGKLAKSAFVYSEEEDCYYCPMGKKLTYWRTKEKRRGDRSKVYRIYRRDCSGCPLAERCLAKGNRGGRTIWRDAYDGLRQRHARRMRRADMQELYRKRGPTVETVFGYMKGVKGFRQFLHRGREKVSIEWCWGMVAYNFGKLLGHLRARRMRLRQETGT